MISERQLRQIAGRKALSVGQAEHEYVMLCALDTLGKTPPLSTSFCLKGGTVLRLFYFTDWRHSVDLDFTVLPDFPGDDLLIHLQAWFAQLAQLHGIEMTLRDFHRANGAARVRSRFVGPLRHPNRLLLDITLDEAVRLPPPHRPAIGSLFDDLQPTVLCYALEEILAEKLRSILQRGKARDYYDVWRLLGEKATAFDRPTTRRVLTEKCAYKGLPDPTRPISSSQPFCKTPPITGTKTWQIRYRVASCRHGHKCKRKSPSCWPGFSRSVYTAASDDYPCSNVPSNTIPSRPSRLVAFVPLRLFVLQNSPYITNPFPLRRRPSFGRRAGRGRCPRRDAVSSPAGAGSTTTPHTAHPPHTTQSRRRTRRKPRPDLPDRAASRSSRPHAIAGNAITQLARIPRTGILLDKYTSLNTI